MWSKNVGVRAENWPEYLQIAIYRSPKIPHESCVAFGQKRQKSKMATSGYFDKNYKPHEGQNMVTIGYSEIKCLHVR